MQVLIPQALKVLNDSVPEAEAPSWDKATAYTKDQRVMYDHYIYKAVDAVPAGTVPAGSCPGGHRARRKLRRRRRAVAHNIRHE